MLIAPRIALHCAHLLLPCLQCLPTSLPLFLQDFREPLYLTDKPVVYKDTRTEEEKRYPQLFRRVGQGRAEGVAEGGGGARGVVGMVAAFHGPQLRSQPAVSQR